MRSVILVLMTLALGGFIRPAQPVWAQAPVASGTVITIAGIGGPVGFSGDGGPATSASLHDPRDLAIGPDGTLYFIDAVNVRIRAVDPVTGIITTVAGNGNFGDTGNGGPATEATFGGNLHLAVDRARDALYVSDVGNHWVRKVDLSTGLLTAYAGQGPDGVGFSGDGGPATGAFFTFPEGVAVDASGRLSIADLFNDRIRRVDPDTGIITTSAGSGDHVHVTAGDGGPATAATFAGSAGVVSSDSAGNVFVSDQSASTRIRRIDAITGIITTVVGGGASPLGAGSATDINLGNVHAYTAVDDAGRLFFAHGNRVFKVDLGTGQLSLFAGAASGDFSGDGGPALDARFNAIGGLALVPGGGLLISDTANQRIRYIAPDSINLVGDAGQAEFYLPWVSALSGDITITNNPNLSVINMGALATGADIDISGNTSATLINLGALATGADIDISGNTSATVINMGALATSGDINISGNTSATAINMGALATSGDIDISGNTSATVINMGALATSGDIDISGNGNATVALDSLESVTGDVTIETTGSGTFDMNGADVGGDINLTLDGYMEVAGATADDSTAVTMFNNEATMEVTLPDGAFTSETPVAFSITNEPGSTETIDGNTVTHLGTYGFEFAIPTLNSDTELNFEIELAAMDEPDRLSLLDLLHNGALLTLGVRGDEPGAELQLFDLCVAGGPVADSCAVVQWLDENRMLLDPLGGNDPVILRLEGLVGHFSTYSFVAVSLPGDYNLNGIVDGADYVVWRKNDGTPQGYNTWRANFGAVSLAIGAGSGSSSSTTVPEPASALLLMLAAAIGTFRGRRIASPVLSTRQPLNCFIVDGFRNATGKPQNRQRTESDVAVWFVERLHN